LCRRGSSSEIDVIGGEGRPPLLPALLIVSALLLLAPPGLTPFGSLRAWAQATGTPAAPSEGQTPPSGQLQPQTGQDQPAPFQPIQPAQPQQQQPTAAPQWTPPIPPAPSQSHVPGPFLPPAGIAPGAIFEYHPTLSLSEEFTDNYRLSTKRQQSNFRTTLTPGSTILMNGAKTQGSVSATSGFAYDTISGETSMKIFPSLTAAIQHSLTPRLSLTLTDSFDRNDAPTRGESTGLRTERRTFTSNTFGASVGWLIDLLQTQYYYRNALFLGDTTTISHVFGLGASTRLGALDTVQAGYEYSISQPEEGMSSHGQLFSGSIGHQFGYFVTAGVQGSYSTQSLNEQRIWNGSVFATYGLPTGLAFSGRVGYSVLTSDAGSQQNGLSASATASYAHARGIISLAYFQDFRTTYQGGQNLQTGQDQSSQNFGVVESRGLTGNFTYQLTPYIGSFIQAAYYQNTNTGVGNTKSDTSQDYLTAGAGINWQFLRWFSMNLTYTRNEFTQPDRHENRAVLSLNAAF